MAIWSLSEIRTKVRQVTGRYNPEELSNAQLDEYINKYFQYTFPAELKLERFHTYFDLITVANQQTYTFPSGYVNFEPAGYLNNKLLLWYQDPDTFMENNPENISSQTVGTGDGVTTAFSTSAIQFPLIPGSAVISDSVEYFQDTNKEWTTSDVTIDGSEGGVATLNYDTGAVTATFNTAPVSGDSVYFSYIQFQAGEPVAVLMYNNVFKFFPIPDRSYRFKVKAYANSLVTTTAGTTATEFVNATDRPLLDEWGPCIAYGAARDINSDYGEMDAYRETTALYKEQLGYVLRRTNQNLLNTRAMANF